MWHSYFFVLIILPLATSLIAYVVEHPLRETLTGAYRVFRFSPKKVTYPFTMIYISSLLGGFSHIFFDMWTHRYSAYILYPLTIFNAENPFWIGRYEIVVHTAVLLLSGCTIYWWVKRRAERA